MKYFFVRVTTQYDGLEWSHPDVYKGRSQESVERRVRKTDYTHDDGIERQYPAIYSIEISKEEYDVLSKHL